MTLIGLLVLAGLILVLFSEFVKDLGHGKLLVGSASWIIAIMAISVFLTITGLVSIALVEGFFRWLFGWML